MTVNGPPSADRTAGPGDLFLRAAVIAVIAAVQFALTFPDAPVYRDLIKLYLFHLLGWPLALWVWASGRVRFGAVEAVLGAFLALTAAAALWGAYPAYAWERVANLALAAAWFSVVRAAAAGPGGREWLLAAFFWTGAALACTGLAHYWVLPAVTGCPRDYRMRFPASDPNSFGLVMIPVLGLGCWHVHAALRAARRARAMVCVAALLAAAAAFASARSQTAAVGLAAGSMVFACAWWHAGGTPARRRGAVAAALVLVLAGCAAAAVLYPRLGGTFAVRRLCWAAGVRIVAARPFGAGPGTAGALLPAYLDPAWHVTEGFGDYVYHLHSEYLEVAAEAGVPGLALFGFLLALLWAAYYRDWTGRFWPGAVAGAALASMAVEMIAGVSMRLMSAPVVFWFVAALAPAGGRAWTLPRAVRPAAAGLVGLVGAASSALPVESWRAEQHLAAAMDARRPAAERAADFGRARNNRLFTLDSLKASFYRAGILMGAEGGWEGAPEVDEALAEVRRLNARHADFINSRMREGILLCDRSEPAAALAAGLAAFRLNPFAPALHSLLGRSGAAVAGLAAGEAQEDARGKLAALGPYGRTIHETRLVQGLACLSSGQAVPARECLGGVADGGVLVDIAGLAAVPYLMGSDANLPVLITVVEGHLAKYPGDRYAQGLKVRLLHRSVTALLQRGRRNEALFLLETIMELDPSDLDARRLRASLVK